MLLSEKEREGSISAAINVGEQHASEHALQLSFYEVGDGLKTSECIITDPMSRRVKGRGKGIACQSKASAIYEAIEHYHYDFEDKESITSSYTFDFSEPRTSLHFANASPDFYRLLKCRPAPLSCLRFQGLGHDESIDFPSILVDPRYNPPRTEERVFIEETGIFRYSSNSGTAAGVSSAEAILHGLLEIIERDALGICFAKTTLSNQPQSLRNIRTTSLPDGMANIVEEIIQETAGSITFWDITTDIRVPVTLCRLSIAGYNFFGSGASLAAQYAIERSALEALQVYHIQKFFGPWLQNPTVDVGRMSRYRRCCLDSGTFAFRGGEVDVGFDDMLKCESNESLDMQIKYIVNSLESVGIKSFYRILLDKKVSVCQVVSPVLERLFLLMHGVPVAPSWRGKTSI